MNGNDVVDLLYLESVPGIEEGSKNVLAMY